MIKKQFMIPPLALLLIFAILTGCGEPKIPAGYALIYGVADYSPWSGFSSRYILNDLTLTDDDARDMAAMLEARGWTVRLRINDGTEPGTGAASRNRLEADIAELKVLMDDDDRFLFYYSGHGASIADEAGNIEPEAAQGNDEWLFLYPDNPDWNTQEWLDQTINDDALGLIISELEAKIKIVILDSCNSGGFIGTGPGVDGIPSDYTHGQATSAGAGDVFRAFFSFPDSQKADILTSQAIVMSAAGETEESWEDSSIGHGIFTYFLLKSPAEGDGNKDGWITITEAYDYCRKKIEEEWNSPNSGENYHYLPHITGTPVDFILFPAD